MSVALVGDIGGTNARLALWQDGQLAGIEVLACADYASPEAAISEYLARHQAKVSRLCLACAGPVNEGRVTLTNNHWQVESDRLRSGLELVQAELINDFTAMALGVTLVGADELLCVSAGVALPDRMRLVMGPGTGLGVAGLLPMAEGRWQVVSGEGGHVSLPSSNPREAAILALLQQQQAYVNAETILSGGGLLRLYQVSCQLDGCEAQYHTPAQVTAAALNGDLYADAVLEQFCCWLGQVMGNAAVLLGARGGVYIAGGVVPRFAERFLTSGFHQAFYSKGSMRDYLQPIPIYVVQAQWPGLLGAGAWLEQTA
ncbi:glucokinase [Atopomonas sediminilitoris]|uniref:glucokinase n=1 Tax=Atopomonas sediminilitoris TaxID=2919919 RepID=UPI001F4DDDD6|nr:glucokinase [Atopomonas sediminilitoris]MCJ8169078.1 glucokinase [Atopomonas sediminilitoris]